MFPCITDINRQAWAALGLSLDHDNMVVKVFTVEQLGRYLFITRESGGATSSIAYCESFKVGPRGAVTRMSNYLRF